MKSLEKIYIETYGCSMNKADSEFIAGILAEDGYSISSSIEDADVIILNSCVVKTPTERKIIRRISQLRKLKKKLLVAGCLPLAIPSVVDQFKDVSFIGTNVEVIKEAISAIKAGKRYVNISKSRACKPELPKIRMNPIVEIIPIAEGCVGNCSYCIIKLARKELMSFPKDSILARVKKAIKTGAKEIWLTAQDTGAYGLDLYKDYKLPELLEEICKLKGDFKLRVGMMNPNHLLNFLSKLIKIYSKEEKIYKFIHIPLQSGSNQILKLMGRKYTAEDFKLMVKKLRENIEAITISTDIIVGFPQETEEQFNETLKLLKETEPDIINISRFWPRPGTKAEKLEQLHSRVTKERSRIATKLFEEIGLKRNKRWLNWQGTALVSGKGKNDSYISRNFAYKPIVVHSKENIFGKEIEVKVKDCTYFDLRGEIISHITPKYQKSLSSRSLSL